MSETALGLPGPWAMDKYEASDHYTTKIGGLPDWPIPEGDVRPDLLKCDICGGDLFLIAQMYAPLPRDSWETKDRVIYILGCAVPKCAKDAKSWHALRFQKFDGYADRGPLVIPAEPLASSAPNWWDAELLDDVLSEDDVDLQQLEAAFAKATLATCSSKKGGNLHLQSSMKVSPHDSGMLNKRRDIDKLVLPCFYICCKKEQAFSSASGRCLAQATDVEGSQDKEVWEQEAYEYDKALGADRTYLKFKKCLDACPDQCFRYSFNGNPLLAASDIIAPGTCNLCGAPRQYEMQLMSPVLYFLREAADGLSADLLDAWSWITLIVFTCPESCSPIVDDSCSHQWCVAKEFIFVQYEDV